MGKIPERLLYLRGVGPRTDYQFRTILRKTGLAGCCTKHHPGRFPGFRDLRRIGVGQLSGQLLRASVFDDLLIPGVAPLVVGGFPLRLSSGAVFLPALLFCSSGRYWLIRRIYRFLRPIQRQLRLHCRGSTLCGLIRGFGGRFRGCRGGADFFFDAAEGPFLAFCGFRLFRYFCHASLSSFSSFPGELTPSFGRPSAVKSSC